MQHPSLITKGWLRVVLFLICYLLLIIASGTGMNWLVANNGTESWQKNIPVFYVSVFINFIISLVLVFFFRIALDRKTITSLGMQRKGFAKEQWTGFLTAFLINGAIASVLFLMQLIQLFTTDFDAKLFGVGFLLLVIVAVGEELVFRGYILTNLMDSAGKEAALFLSAIIFAVFHSLNPDFNLTAFVNIFLAGVLLGINYIFTRNLWFGFIFHFTWNFVQGMVLGFPVSGLDLPALLAQDSKASVLLSGGAFGLEASWLATFFLAAAAFLLYQVFQKKYKCAPLT